MMALKPPFFVISDTHFFHDRIVDYCDRPYDHETMILKRWQRAIKPSDEVLHLGDLFLGGPDGYTRFQSELAHQLPGRKFIILGNHDRKRYDYEALGFNVLKPFTLTYRGYDVSFDHYPKLLNLEQTKRLHVHGHIHNHGYAQQEPTRWGNINVSIEVMDYRPHRISRLLNKAILARNQKQRFYNSRHVRFAKRNRQRRYVS